MKYGAARQYLGRTFGHSFSENIPWFEQKSWSERKWADTVTLGVLPPSLPVPPCLGMPQCSTPPGKSSSAAHLQGSTPATRPANLNLGPDWSGCMGGTQLLCSSTQIQTRVSTGKFQNIPCMMQTCHLLQRSKNSRVWKKVLKSAKNVPIC